jgi:gluconolactonase
MKLFAPTTALVFVAAACGGANNPSGSKAGAAGSDGGQMSGSGGGAPGDSGLFADAHETGGATDGGALAFSSIGQPVKISGQFLFTEGPVWDPKKNVLYFSDTNADAIYQLTLPDRFDVLLKPSGNSNGLALDPSGELIAAGFVARNIWRLSSQDGGTVSPIASSYQGKKLNTPDDLIARSDGVIYFTDPIFGLNGTQGFPVASQELTFQGVYRVTTDGALHLEDQSTAGPNGVELSPDEQTLYVSYTNIGEIDSFAVASDGSLRQKAPFAKGVAVADSMCVDSAGNLYVAAVTGIAVFTPAGERLGVISVGQVPTNVAFGGPDQRTLFITARIALIGTPTPGNSALFRIDDMPIPGIPGRP